MSVNRLIKYFVAKPRKVFAFDALGAVFSITVLIIVVTKFEELFGIPYNVLYILMTFAFSIIIYDLRCVTKDRDKIVQFINGVATLNIIYCVLLLALTFHHRETISNLGWAYVMIDISIILSVAVFEFKVARNIH